MLVAVGVALGFLSSASEAAAQQPPPGVAPDREIVEHRVRRGDTCESIASELYGDGRYYFIVGEHNPDARGVLRTQCDAGLRPGKVLRLPRRAVPEGDRPEAEVTAVERHVRARPPRAPSWADAKVGQPLFRGWRVGSLDQSSAELTFRDASKLQLRERTLVIIYGATASSARRGRSRASLERGALRSRLGELSGAVGMQVDTPSARAELRSGEALLRVDEESTSHLSNHSGGPATVSAPDGRGGVKVHPGMGTSVRKGRLPARPRPLPAAPTWDEGSVAEVVVGVAGLGATVEASWSSGDLGGPSTVELEGGPEERRRVEAVPVPAGVAEVELRSVPAGTYSLRVATEGDDGLESPPSEPRRFAVHELALTPSARGGGEGRLPRVLAGTLVEVPRALLCSPPGRRDEPESFALVEPGPATIACRDREGRAAEPVAVEVVPLALRLGDEARLGEVDLERGATTRLALGLEADFPRLGELSLEVEPGPGLEASLDQRGPPGPTVDIAASDDAPEATFVDLVATRGEARAYLARIDVAVGRQEHPGDEAPPADEAPPPPERDEYGLAEHRFTVGPGVPHEGSSLLLQRGSFGVRNERLRGIGAHLAFSYAGEPSGEGDHRLVVAGGIRAAFLEERLRFDVALSVGDDHRPGGGWLGLSTLVLDQGRLGLAVEVGGWFPFGDDEEGWPPARLQPSVDLSVRLGSRVTLRTRQGALIDATRQGYRLWSSAYAVDVWAIGPLTAALEAILALGGDEDGLVAAPALALAAGLRFGIVTFALTARYGFTDDAADLLGELVVLGALRVGAAP